MSCQATPEATSYLVYGKKELDCCSVVHSSLFRWKYILHVIWKSRSQSLEEEWRGTESMLLEVQCEVSTVCDDLGCHVICWCWSTVFSEVHSQRSHLPGNFRALMLPSADKLYGDADFIFQQDLVPAHTAKGTKSLFTYNSVTVLDWQNKLAWPEPQRESMGSCQEEDKRHQTQQCRWPEGRYQSNLGFHYTSAVSQAARIDAVVIFLNWSDVIFKYSETLNFEFSLSVSQNHQNYNK